MRQLRLAMDDSTRVGEARRLAVKLASEAAMTEVEAGRVALVVTELATNLVRHARRGELLLRRMRGEGEAQGVEILSVDAGPGADDGGATWLRDGYSTGGTSGTGLGAVRRQSDEFDLYSQAGRGTVTVARIWASGKPTLSSLSSLAFAQSTPVQARPPVPLQVGVVCLPMHTETSCGDSWASAAEPGRASLMVVDGLGHGPEAARVADRAIEVFQARPFDAPVTVLEAIHAALSGTRGGAAAVARIEGGKVRYAGVGNIAGTLLDRGPPRGLMSHHGTVGVAIRHLQELELPAPAPFALVMHSDGLASRWRPETYPGLWERHASLCASTLYRDFRRERDDITVLVARSSL